MMQKNKIICLDLETTGIGPGCNEILQVSIIDANYNVLINEFCCSLLHSEWPEAEKIHGISPDMVKNCKPFREYKEKVQKIIDKADIIVTYNGKYDLTFLSTYGIKYDQSKHIDVMLEFAPVYGERNYYGFKWQKLTTAAAYYGYEFKAHDSLEDVKATMYIYLKMNEEKQR